jgi:hypothetical protein
MTRTIGKLRLEFSHQVKTSQDKGLPANFFEETSGCLKDMPLMIDSEVFLIGFDCQREEVMI